MGLVGREREGALSFTPASYGLIFLAVYIIPLVLHCILMYCILFYCTRFSPIRLMNVEDSYGDMLNQDFFPYWCFAIHTPILFVAYFLHLCWSNKQSQLIVRYQVHLVKHVLVFYYFNVN